MNLTMTKEEAYKVAQQRTASASDKELREAFNIEGEGEALREHVLELEWMYIDQCSEDYLPVVYG